MMNYVHIVPVHTILLLDLHPKGYHSKVTLSLINQSHFQSTCGYGIVFAIMTSPYGPNVLVGNTSDYTLISDRNFDIVLFEHIQHNLFLNFHPRSLVLIKYDPSNSFPQANKRLRLLHDSI